PATRFGKTVVSVWTWIVLLANIKTKAARYERRLTFMVFFTQPGCETSSPAPSLSQRSKRERQPQIQLDLRFQALL
ncbi:MAG TPA: hypothetical protein VK249_16120, partial [Anaerolineales bacterium]|nr:hypothetical protein [Anaerolineales bacterium]